MLFEHFYWSLKFFSNNNITYWTLIQYWSFNILSLWKWNSLKKIYCAAKPLQIKLTWWKYFPSQQFQNQGYIFLALLYIFLAQVYSICYVVTAITNWMYVCFVKKKMQPIPHLKKKFNVHHKNDHIVECFTITNTSCPLISWSWNTYYRSDARVTDDHLLTGLQRKQMKNLSL